MSRRFEPQDGTGVIARKAPIGVLIINQPNAPTGGQAGFATGCLWLNTAGTVGSCLYVNTGTKTSATWTNVT